MTSPLRFSITRCPKNAGLTSPAALFLYKRASGSVSLSCVSRNNFFPLRPLPCSGGSFFSWKLRRLAHASISVPSTVKCSSDSSCCCFGLRQHLIEKQFRDLPVQQSVPVLGEHRRVPHRLIHAQSHKPAEQQVVLQPLHQLPLAAHAVQRLQQQRPQQPLRRNRRPPQASIQRVKLRRHRLQRRVGHRPHAPQRMVFRHALLHRYVTKQIVLLRVVSSHAHLDVFTSIRLRKIDFFRSL